MEQKDQIVIEVTRSDKSVPTARTRAKGMEISKIGKQTCAALIGEWQQMFSYYMPISGVCCQMWITFC